MDPEGRVTIRDLVLDLRSSGVAVLLTSHDLVDVERLADRIVVLVAGRVVAAGTPPELAAGARPTMRWRLDRPLGADELGGLDRALGGHVIEAPTGGYLLDGRAPDAAAVAALAAWCAGQGRLIVELRTTGGSLEDAYLGLVGGPAS
jgi:ABC-2 type transport system ATP-binding protein